jgi:hypothetical protein
MATAVNLQAMSEALPRFKEISRYDAGQKNSYLVFPYPYRRAVLW